MTNRFPALPVVACWLVFLGACSSATNSRPPAAPDRRLPPDASGSVPDGQGLSTDTVLDLNDLKTNPTPHAWFDFRPNVKKLILTGAPETQHVAILWYTTAEGGVGLHYHSKTESVYVIDGTQTDAKGVYPTGTVYFNPPGSGHKITHSTGFFVLAYAAPPDFKNTTLIGDYTPVRIDTGAPDLTSLSALKESKSGVRIFPVPLVDAGGMSAAFVEITSPADYVYVGNYLLVVKGSCEIQGATLAKNWLVVGKTVKPRPYKIAASKNSSCLAMGVSF